MKLKNIALLSVLLMAVSGCGQRYSPDEFTVIKYKPLVMPKKFVLVKPIQGKKSLGHIEPRDVIAGETLSRTRSKNNAGILKKFKIKNVDSAIRQELKQPLGRTILVDVVAEQKRIQDNLNQGKSVTYGKTPMIDTKYTKTGFNELFGD